MSANANVIVRSNLWKVLRGELWASRAPLTVLVAVSLLSMPIALALPFPVKLIVDSVIGSQPAPGGFRALLPDSWLDGSNELFLVAILMLLLLSILNNAHGQVLWLLSEISGERMVLRLRSRMFEHVQRISLAYHDDEGLADATYRIQLFSSGRFSSQPNPWDLSRIRGLLRQ